MRIQEVTGGGGVRLHVRDCGPEQAPALIFLHGWSQHHLCWRPQVDAPELAAFRRIALDLRGHGMSDAPPEREAYTDGALWADDVAAVLDALGVERAILIGWSYGGYIIGDYLARHGEARLAGVVMVGGAIHCGRAAVGRFIGPGITAHIPAMTGADQPAALAATAAFVKGCTHRPLDEASTLEMMGYNALVPPAVRKALFARTLDFTPQLAAFTLPLLVVHGRQDTICLPAMAEAMLAACTQAELHWFDDTGHMPMREQPQRFNRLLADFARTSLGP
jgi:pimeloyl-ACP methyl ester carboxylesterase